MGKADELREYLREAELVEQLTKTEGWFLLSRDITNYKEKIGSSIAYLEPTSKEFNECRILYLASDKLLSLVADYAENKKRTEELLVKLENPKDNVVLDVDNEE